MNCMRRNLISTSQSCLELKVGSVYVASAKKLLIRLTVPHMIMQKDRVECKPARVGTYIVWLLIKVQFQLLYCHCTMMVLFSFLRTMIIMSDRLNDKVQWLLIFHPINYQVMHKGWSVHYTIIISTLINHLDGLSSSSVGFRSLAGFCPFLLFILN